MVSRPPSPPAVRLAGRSGRGAPNAHSIHGAAGLGAGIQQPASRATSLRVRWKQHSDDRHADGRFDARIAVCPRFARARRLARARWSHRPAARPPGVAAPPQVDRPARGRARQLDGISPERQGPGVRFDSFGIVGATADTMVRSRTLDRLLAAVQPDLVIVSLGTNDATARPFREDVFSASVSDLVARVRGARPGAAVLLTTPPDSFLRATRRTRPAPNPAVIDVRRLVLESAVSLRVVGPVRRDGRQRRDRGVAAGRARARRSDSLHQARLPMAGAAALGGSLRRLRAVCGQSI